MIAASETNLHQQLFAQVSASEEEESFCVCFVCLTPLKHPVQGSAQ